MIYYLIKVGITACMVVMISEVSKRSSFFGALLASLPLTSLLAILWMYFEKRTRENLPAIPIDFLVGTAIISFFYHIPSPIASGNTILGQYGYCHTNNYNSVFHARVYPAGFQHFPVIKICWVACPCIFTLCMHNKLTEQEEFLALIR